MAPDRKRRNGGDPEGQMGRLAGTLRDSGVAPDRDLWGDISTAIDRETAAGRSRDSGSEPTPVRRRAGWLQPVAIAALVAFLMVAGWWAKNVQDVSDPGPTGIDPVAQVGDDALDEGGLAVINEALGELQAALDANPDNKNLADLVLMVHQTRGNLLRRTADERARGG